MPLEIDGRRLDPQLQWMLGVLSKASRAPLHTLPVPRARREYAMMPAIFEDPLPRPPTTDLEIDGADGPIRARLYGPRATRPGPLLLYFHGGGGVIGDLETHDGCCRRLALASACSVLSVDYRLGPEHPFPASHDDAVAAFRWVVAHASELGVDPTRIAVGGDSMGGNLAAAVCLALRGETSPRFQLLIYPGTDWAGRTESRERLGHGLFLDDATLQWFSDHLLQGADPTDPRVSVLRAEDHSGLPPALVLTCGFDPLRDEGQAYARALQAAGNDVEHLEYASLLHGFVQMTGVCRAAARALDDCGRAVGRALRAV